MRNFQLCLTARLDKLKYAPNFKSVSGHVKAGTADGSWGRSWAEAVATGPRGPAEVALPGRPGRHLYSFLLPPSLCPQARHLRPSAEGRWEGSKEPRRPPPPPRFLLGSPTSHARMEFLFLSPFALFCVCFSLCSLRLLDSLTRCTSVSFLSILLGLSSVSPPLIAHASIAPLLASPCCPFPIQLAHLPLGPPGRPTLVSLSPASPRSLLGSHSDLSEMHTGLRPSLAETPIRLPVALRTRPGLLTEICWP